LPCSILTVTQARCILHDGLAPILLAVGELDIFSHLSSLSDRSFNHTRTLAVFLPSSFPPLPASLPSPCKKNTPFLDEWKHRWGAELSSSPSCVLSPFSPFRWPWNLTFLPSFSFCSHLDFPLFPPRFRLIAKHGRIIGHVALGLISSSAGGDPAGVGSPPCLVLFSLFPCPVHYQKPPPPYRCLRGGVYLPFFP